VYFERTLFIRGSLTLLIGALAAAAILSGCGSGGTGQASTNPRPASSPPQYHQANYDVEIFSDWPQEESDKRVGAYSESAWADPESAIITLRIDSRPSAGTGTPVANAELARAQVNHLPGYQERSFGKISLGGRSAIRWTYNLFGEGRVGYFFSECGTSFAVLGATPPQAFASLSESFQEMAGTIKALCSE